MSFPQFSLQPEYVDRTVIVDISQYNRVSGGQEIPAMLQTIQDLKLDNNLGVSEGRKLVGEALKRVVPEQATRDFILLNLVKNAEQQFEWRINIDTLKSNLPEISKFPQKILAKKFCGPTLFIGGQNSNYIEPRDVAKIKVNFPLAQFEFIERAGHLVHIDQPARFLEVTTKFLNE